jgi:hypothetical protein
MIIIEIDRYLIAFNSVYVFSYALPSVWYLRCLAFGSLFFCPGKEYSVYDSRFIQLAAVSGFYTHLFIHVCIYTA